MTIDTIGPAVERLAKEYRATMPHHVLQQWGEEAAATLRALAAERDALGAFKAYTHQRLDGAGIPTHPEGPHSAEGCRVGDRFDLLIADRDAARATLEDARHEMRALLSDRDAARAEVKRLREALALAANRLDRLALLQPHGSARRYEVAEWTVETRAALAGNQQP